MRLPLPASPFAGGGAARDPYKRLCTVSSPAKGRVRVGAIQYCCYPLPTSPFTGGGADRDPYKRLCTVSSPAKGRVRVGAIPH